VVQLTNRPFQLLPPTPHFIYTFFHYSVAPESMGYMTTTLFCTTGPQAWYSSSCCCFFFCWFRVRVWSSLQSEISLLLTRMSHRRTDHWFALLGCDLLLPLLLLFLLLLLFVAVVILLMIQKTPIAPCGWEVYWQGEIRNWHLQ
jgi:hypothetical protein